jgi:hypothetical protein
MKLLVCLVQYIWCVGHRVLHLSEQIPQVDMNKPHPLIKSTCFPKEKLTFNEWSTHIHTEIKKQYEPRRENLPN